MAIYTISDLHLSFSSDKPMNIFGGAWQNHEKNIKENWFSTVNELIKSVTEIGTVHQNPLQLIKNKNFS